MNGSTHCDITLTVLEALEWKGDVKLAARNAVYPDTVRSIEVDGQGCTMLGHNFAAFCHFLVPEGGDKFGGYSWPSDRSVPALDWTKRKVIAHPEAWGFPVIDPFIQREPLAKLIRDLTTPGHMGTIEADKITYPAASIMADWAFQIFEVWANDSQSARRQEALDILTGWMMHLAVQDPVIPHHADGLLLDGHTAFEGDVDECWRQMKGKGEVDDLLETLVEVKVPTTETVRGIAEDRATAAAISPKKLGWYRCFWRRGWNRLVRQSVLAGLTHSVRLGRILQRTAR